MCLSAAPGSVLPVRLLAPPAPPTHAPLVPRCAQAAAEAERSKAQARNKELIGRLSETEARLAHAEQHADELAGSLAERTGEVDNLTMALQRAILDQKGAAEEAQKWKKGTPPKRPSYT